MNVNVWFIQLDGFEQGYMYTYIILWGLMSTYACFTFLHLYFFSAIEHVLHGKELYKFNYDSDDNDYDCCYSCSCLSSSLDGFTWLHTETVVADQTCYLILSWYINVGQPELKLTQ